MVVERLWFGLVWVRGGCLVGCGCLVLLLVGCGLALDFINEHQSFLFL